MHDYEDHMKKLELIIKEFENKDFSLDKVGDKVSEAYNLMDELKRMLFEAEIKVNEIIELRQNEDN
jgi:exodeoxyribonuclease VII small subunit